MLERTPSGIPVSPHRRVTVTSPQTRLAHSRRKHRAAWRPPTLDPAEVRGAMIVYRAQRRRVVVALVPLFLLLLGLPVLLNAFPALDEVKALGIPVSWLAMVAVPFPAMVLIAWWHLRHAEKIEDAAEEQERG
ncbi:MAG: hypothetical protein M3443_07410 [Actinomycetota bacterium]|nr:hypothetical protein [Actinomycetota bacterium]